MERSGFFTSIYYNENDFAEMFSAFIKDGIFIDYEGMLQVVPEGASRNVIVKTGKLLTGGARWYKNITDMVVSVNVPDGVLNRIDAIVNRYDKVLGKINTVYEVGTFAVEPTKYQPVNNELFAEKILAYIHVEAGQTVIEERHIEDTRLDENLCGVVRNLVDSIDMTQFYQQVQDQLDYLIETNNTEYGALITELEEALRTALAGALPDNTVSLAKLTEEVRNNNVINEYEHNGNVLTGSGKNGVVKATSNITTSNFTIGSDLYSVKQNGETEIKMQVGEYYSFTLDEVEKTINFQSQGNTRSVVVPAGTDPTTVDVPNDTIIFILK